jgi:hypothetical protein
MALEFFNGRPSSTVPPRREVGEDTQIVDDDDVAGSSTIPQDSELVDDRAVDFSAAEGSGSLEARGPTVLQQRPCPPDAVLPAAAAECSGCG